MVVALRFTGASSSLKENSVVGLRFFIESYSTSMKTAINSYLVLTILCAKSLKLLSPVVSASKPSSSLLRVLLGTAVELFLPGLAGDLAVLWSRNSLTKLLSTLSNSVLMS